MQLVTDRNTVSGLGNYRQFVFGLMRHGILVLAWLVFLNAQSAHAQIGDFNMDGVLNSVDVNLLTAEIAAGTNNPSVDVNGDGLVNSVDLSLWFPFYSTDSGVPLSIALVDVDFDTFNTAADFQFLQSNLGVATTDFTDGNLNADSLVDSADLDLYLSRGGVVPEPSSAMLLLTAVVCFLRRRRRR